MDDQDEARPVGTRDEIDRTGRDAQVVGRDPKAGPGATAPPALDDDDAPEGGVDSAEFPGTAAP